MHGAEAHGVKGGADFLGCGGVIGPASRVTRSPQCEWELGGVFASTAKLGSHSGSLPAVAIESENEGVYARLTGLSSLKQSQSKRVS